MGIDPAPQMANLYLYYYEAKFMEMLTKKTTVQPKNSTTPDILLMTFIPSITMDTEKKTTIWAESTHQN